MTRADRPRRKGRRYAAAAIALVLGLLGWQEALAQPAAVALNPKDRADIARVETYLNELGSIRARFIQTDSTGSLAEGRLFLRRPGKLRLDYDPPAKLQIFADGFWLIFVDGELEEANHVPLSATPAHVLLDENIRLADDVMVTRVERGAQTLRLHLVQTEDPDAGTLMLTFTDRPFALRQWTIIDAQGIETRVSLINPEFNVFIDNRVFVVDVPRVSTPGDD